MGNVFIHPKATTDAYAANEAIALSRMGLAYYSQLKKCFGIANNNSDPGTSDYAAMALAFGITEPQAAILWAMLNGSIQGWEGTSQKADNNNLIQLVG
jgi:hypothetical protein